MLAPVLALALVCTLSLPASAFFWNKKTDVPSVSDFSKNGMVGQVISFSAEDFPVSGGSGGTALAAITLKTLPDIGAGMLTVGGQPLTEGALVDASALSGLQFQALPTPSVNETAFTFLPSFTTGETGEEVTVTLYLLTEANEAPIARNMDLSTYKNVAITGWFDAEDGEGDSLTFQLRGAVTVAEDGSSQFVYTPYENKTGKDSFTYVAVDPAGNVSPEAKVSIQIEKPDTKVTYADMEGNPAHKASIRLAEEGIFVGSYVNGSYFFDPDQPVSRAEFLTMAMAATGLEPLEDVTLTGFYDDEAIPTWAKGYVSSALKAGAIQGSLDQEGQPVFGSGEPVTRGEATVMLDNLMGILDVPAEVFASESGGHWAGQAAANLSASGVIHGGDDSAQAMADPLTRADVAELLDGVLACEDAPFDMLTDLAAHGPEDGSRVADELPAFHAALHASHFVTMLRIGRELLPFDAASHTIGVHNIATLTAQCAKEAGLPVDVPLVSAAALCHDIGKFGCRGADAKRIPYLHYYYTWQWLSGHGMEHIAHISANHSTWDLEFENLPVESLLLIYADFRVRGTREGGRETVRIYSLAEAYAIILSKLADVTPEKERQL